MDAYKIAIKLFVERDVFSPAEFLPIFHSWIRDQALADHLLIDVADYAHVPAGPGSLLVSAEANIHMDRGGDRLGLLYIRKLPLPGDFAERVRAVLASTLKLAEQLEQEPTLAGRLKFRADEIVIRLNDRLLAPNTPETFAAVKPDLETLARALQPDGPISLASTAPPASLFEVTIKLTDSPPVATLRQRIDLALSPAL